MSYSIRSVGTPRKPQSETGPSICWNGTTAHCRYRCCRNSTYKRREPPGPIPCPIAAGLIATWTRFRVQEITLSILTGALEIKAAHGFSYWDSAIIAAARALGCRTLYTEDMAHGREVEGIAITNPFS